MNVNSEVGPVSPTSGFPGAYGYLPAPMPGDRHAAASAAAAAHAAAATYYADFAAAAPQANMASHVGGVPRSEPSPMPVSNSPMHREQYSQRTPTGISRFSCFSSLLMEKKTKQTKSKKKKKAKKPNQKRKISKRKRAMKTK